MKPSNDEIVRRCTRVLSMVHELHKAGYQKIRILPGLSGSGAHWRCNITYSDNMLSDGYSIKDFMSDEIVARYSSAQASDYFGWPSANSMTSREMATRFLVDFPLIRERGLGRDWAYAGWLVDVLGRAEQGQKDDLLALDADYPLEADMISNWLPPSLPSAGDDMT